ncbi:MAG: I78 family peptidase inhibitor [Paracoccaceae bacterium]
MHVPAFAAILPLIMASACVPQTPPPAPPAMAEDACGAGPLQHLVGQPASVLDRMKFRQTVRILRPGMAVTMDFRADRLNIAIGADGRIERVYCS